MGGLTDTRTKPCPLCGDTVMVHTKACRSTITCASCGCNVSASGMSDGHSLCLAVAKWNKDDRWRKPATKGLWDIVNAEC